MQKLIPVVLILSFMSVTSIFAEEAWLESAPTNTRSLMNISTDDAVPWLPDLPVMREELNAAPVPSVKPSLGSSLWEYQSIACTTYPAFATNSCDQCFSWGSLKVGDNLSWLFDNWINNTDKMLIAYKDEQKSPNMISFGKTTWTTSPTDTAKFWKNASDITWVPAGWTGSRLNYILQPGQKVRFIESDLGARYTLEKSDRKNGELIGILKFPVVAHSIDSTTGAEGAASTHAQCVSYTLTLPPPVATVVTPPTPKPPAPKPTPAEVTQTQTGPAETLILIVAAFFIAFGMMFSLRKRN